MGPIALRHHFKLILFRGQFVWNAEGVVMLSVKGFAWVSGLCKVEVLSDMTTQAATVHSVQCCSLVLVTCCSSMMRDRRQISIHPSSCRCRWCSSCSIVFCLAPSAQCPSAWPLLCKLMPKPDNLLPFRFPEQYTADPLHYCTSHLPWRPVNLNLSVQRQFHLPPALFTCLMKI